MFQKICPGIAAKKKSSVPYSFYNRYTLVAAALGFVACMMTYGGYTLKTHDLIPTNDFKQTIKETLNETSFDVLVNASNPMTNVSESNTSSIDLVAAPHKATLKTLKANQPIEESDSSTSEDKKISENKREILHQKLTSAATALVNEMDEKQITKALESGSPFQIQRKSKNIFQIIISGLISPFKIFEVVWNFFFPKRVDPLTQMTIDGSAAFN